MYIVYRILSISTSAGAGSPTYHDDLDRKYWMPRKFSKDSFFEGDLTPEMIGFDDLSSRKISEALQEEDPQNAENYTHRNIFSGLPCECGYWHPEGGKEEQTKVAAEEEAAPRPNILLVINNNDEARIKLMEWLEDESNGYEFTGSARNQSAFRNADAAIVSEVTPEQRELLKANHIGVFEISPPEAALIAQQGVWSGIKHDIDEAVEQTHGQREDFVPDLKTNAGRKIFKQNQKIFRRNGPLSEEIVGSQSQGGANAGPKVLERLDNLCAQQDAEGLLPWLAARLAKGEITPNFGYRGSLARGNQIGLNYGNHQSVDLLFDRIATWFNARQSPFRQGKNVMEMNVGQAADIADEHLEWVRSQAMIKQYSTQLLEDEMSKRKEDELQRANTPPDEPYNPMVVDLPQAIEARNMQILEEQEDARLRGDTSRDEPNTMEDLVERGYPGIIDPEKYKGWRAVQITTEDSARLETAILGHCIGSGAQPYVYGIKDGAVECFSLRDPDGIPKATWHWNPDDNSLGHIQGRSGDPKDEWRELISAFNDFTGRDDDGGGGGDDAMATAASDHDYDYFYSNGMESFLESETWEEGDNNGLTYWDFGTVEEISRAEAIMEEPWDMIRQFSDDPIDDECELEANPDVDALAADAVENYNSYPEEFIRLLSDDAPYFYGMKLGDLIKGILDYWAEDYENDPREKAQYEVDENGENVVYGFDEMALKDEVDEGRIDERLLSLIQLRTPPGKDPMAGEYKERINPRETLTPRDLDGERKRDPIPEDYTAPPEGWGTTNKDPFDNLPLTENQPVTVRQYNREPEEVPFSERMGEPMYNTFVEPRNNPADIAREYSRIWTNEGQSAANKWYYENYPNAQPVNQQLTSGWNGLMRS
jgi:hypothetical protein